ncbi:MAG: membrane protein insertase YidC [Acidobacteriota bacterium]
MEQQSSQTQYRFIIAAALSMVVLFGWSYLYNPSKPVDNSNTASFANANVALPTPAPSVQAQPQTPATVATSPDTTPNRTITIKSPLYEVTLDSKGAVASSWILLKNKSPLGEYPVYADGSNSTDKKPLQLISQRALDQNPRELPFRLSTADPNVTSLLNERNYQISAPEESVSLADGEEKRIEFTLAGDNGIEVKKTFVFRGGSYVADLAVDLKQNGQPVPDTRLVLGASIGDHAINYHNLYHTEPDAVAAIDGDIKRHLGSYSFTYDANNQATLTDNGPINWVGMSDAYFGMAAIPATPVQTVEYRASKYDVPIQPVYENIYRWVIRSPKTTETRHLVTAYLPVATDGSVTKIYTGTKDYFLLNSLTDSLSNDVGREVSIVNLINFSNYWWLRWLTKPLSIPILYALHYINGVTANYGLAIIIFTLLFYSLLFPLRWSQSKSFKKAAGNAPKMKAIQDQIKDLQKKGIPADDPRMRALQMEQLKMTKDALPIGGCLPMLLQFPLLIAFYTAITVSLDARQATFMWLPDLSAADPLHLLEFGFAFSMVLAMKFTPTAPAVSPEQQMQQKMMTYLMPVMMLWVMWTAPAGLLIYWLFGNVVSFGQQMLINRFNKKNQPPAAEIVDSVPKDAKKVKGKPKLSTS